MQTERQKEIVDVALELISKKGIQGLTMKNLAKKIGITEPAIYRHFDNKIHILTTILDLFKKNSEQIFNNGTNNNNAVAKIEYLFSRQIATFSMKPSLVSVVFSEEIFRNEPLLIEKISDIISKNDMILKEIIISGQKNGELRNDIEAKYLATILMGCLRLCVKKWQLSEYSYSLIDEGKQLLKSIKLLIVK